MIRALPTQGLNVGHACAMLGVSESGYYAWKDGPDPPRMLRRIWLIGRSPMSTGRQTAPTALRATAELHHGHNVIAGHRAVESIMRELGVKGYRSTDHRQAVRHKR